MNKFCYTGDVWALSVELEAAFEILSEQTDFYVSVGWNAGSRTIIVFRNFSEYAFAVISVEKGDVVVNRLEKPHKRVVLPIVDYDCYDVMVKTLQEWASDPGPR